LGTDAYVRAEPAGRASLNLLVENLHCGGCVNKIERTLAAVPGVIEARAGLTSRRLRVVFDPVRADGDALAATVSGLGYHVVPFDPAALGDSARAEDRRLLISLAVAGFAAANVMLLSVSVWAGAGEMGPAMRDLMHWVSALIALPVVAFAGQPFYRSALRALAARGLNMDVPISLAVLLATGMSLHETMVGGPDTYFDAALTLLFFLLVGRYLDRRARSRR